MSARSRARSVGDAFNEATAVATPFGDVAIESVQVDDESVIVSVGNPEGGDATFVVVNPPTLVPDVFGDIIVNGQAYRHDPVAALAYVIASNGGARKGKGRARG